MLKRDLHHGYEKVDNDEDLKVKNESLPCILIHEDKDVKRFTWPYRRFILFSSLLVVAGIIIYFGGTTTLRTADTVTVDTETSASTSAISTRLPNDLEYDYDDDRTRVFMMTFCSGSSAVNQFLYEVLHAHGISIYDNRRNDECKKHTEFRTIIDPRYGAMVGCNNFETEIPKKNPFYDKIKDDPKYASKNINHQQHANEISMDALVEMRKYLKTKNQVLMLKEHTLRADIVSVLQEDRFNSSFTAAIRTNELDRFICQVKDCFIFDHKQVSYTTFENGTHEEFCFDRRGKLEKSEKLFVHLDPDEMISLMNKNLKDDEQIMNLAAPLMSPLKPQAYEDLFAYQYTTDEDVFQSSLKAWAITLEPLVKAVHKDILENHMRSRQDTRHAPPKHADEISNYEEVKSTLEKHGMSHYLRE